MIALLLAFTMGFTIQTAHPTNVVVRYKTACVVSEGTIHTTRQFEAVTPIRRQWTSTPGATSCKLRVVAWDRGPWFDPHHGQTPVVNTWVHD